MTNRHLIINQAIKTFYLSKDRTEEQWQVVSQNLVKFNLVWRRALGLTGEGLPPENMREINPATGEILK